MSDTQKNINSMTSGLRNELDSIRTQMGNLQTAVASGVGTTVGDSQLRAEVEALKGEVKALKLSGASRGSAAARVGSGGGEVRGVRAAQAHDPKGLRWKG